MPNLKEQMQQLMADFDAAETIEAARDIKGRMDELQQLIDTAEEKKNLLDSLNSDKETTVNDTTITLGEYAEKNLNLDAVRNGSAKSAGTAAQMAGNFRIDTALKNGLQQQHIRDRQQETQKRNTDPSCQPIKGTVVNVAAELQPFPEIHKAFHGSGIQQ